MQAGEINVEDKYHPATKHLGSAWARYDEWYAFRDIPRPHLHVLLTGDEASYEGGKLLIPVAQRGRPEQVTIR